MNRMKWFSTLMLILLPLTPVFVVSSCATGVRNGGKFEIVHTYGMGTPGEFTVSVSKTQLSTVEEITLILEAKAAEQWTAALPEIGDSLEKFRVPDKGMEVRKLDSGGNLVYTRSYTLEPFLPGDYSIPPLEIFFEERGRAYSFSLISEEIPVTVSSVLPPLLGEQDIEEILGPMSLGRKTILWASVASIILAAAVAALLRLGKRRPVFLQAAAAPDPWETAFKELNRIREKKLIEHGRYREFYDAISDLTRRYIERRFNVRAPEQTTEEFLQQVRYSDALSQHSPLLEEFLSGCDLVKFARYEPSVEEVERTVHTCESFLAATAPRKTQA
jgi:hypothetical protein